MSDTHGLLRPEAIEVLRGSDLIIHAGDIGKPEVIEGLRSIASVVAIRGNNDRGKWAREFPETAIIEVGEVRIYVIHNVKEIDLDPATAGFSVVISGHSHRPSVVERDGVCSSIPAALARLRVRGESVSFRIVELDV